MLNDYVGIVFKKTHSYDSSAVIKTLELVASWFQRIHINGKLVPPDFDFTFLFKGIQMLLDLDHSTSTAKVIWLLYEITHIIPLKERERLLKQLVQPKNFYKFMFHWGWFVRMAFHYFYFFQLHLLLINNE